MPRVGTSDFDVKVNGTAVPDLVRSSIVEIEVDQRLMMPAQATLTTHGIEPGELPASMLKPGTELELTAVIESARTKLFTGKVATVEVQASPLGTHVRLCAFDALHGLTATRRSEVSERVKASDLASRIAGRHGLSSRVDATTGVLEFVTQAGETDHEFLIRLAQRSDRLVWVEDGGLHFADPGNLQRRTAETKADVDENVLWWNAQVTRSAQPKTITIEGWDTATQKSVSAEAKPKASMVKNGVRADANGVLQLIGPVSTRAEAKARVEAAAREHGDLGTELTVALMGAPDLTIATQMTFENAGKPFDGKYRLTRALHRLDRDGYVTTVECTASEDRSVLGAIHGGEPGLGRSRAEPMVGIVSSINDPENRGRVRLLLPHLGEKLETGWARVIHHGAGKSRGLMILPEVNDEVIVAFEQGDIDRPVVIGATFTPKHKPVAPGFKDGKVTAHTWRSREGHEIALIDEPGKEAITITSADEDVTIAIEKKAKAVKVTTKQSAVEVNAGGDVSVTSKKGVTLSGQTVTISATGALKLKGATTQVNASGAVVVKGTPIKLN